jgi:ABC-type sugar transport system substrate-binding protein
MLLSGELSITTSALLLPLAGALEAAVAEEEEPPAGVELPVLADVVLDELEQAARAAARRPDAVSASTLLLVILWIVNFDLSSRVTD